MKALLWYSWTNREGRVIGPHAFIVLDGVVAEKPVCRNGPGKGIVPVLADPTQGRCRTCDLRLRKKVPGPKVEFRPRHDFEDFEAEDSTRAAAIIFDE